MINLTTLKLKKKNLHGKQITISKAKLKNNREKYRYSDPRPKVMSKSSQYLTRKKMKAQQKNGQ